MRNIIAKSLDTVHTHTHTHTLINLKEEKRVVKTNYSKNS